MNQDSLASMMVRGRIYIPDWKTDHDVNMCEVNCFGDIVLGGAVINGTVYVRGAIIKGNLYLDSALIKGYLILSGTSVEGKLDLDGASIGGDLYLEKVAVKGSINLSFKSGPRKIFVSPDMAELVHWAAPIIPLVVVR